MYTLRKIETEEDYKKVKILWSVHARLMRTKVPERTDLDVGYIVGAFRGDDLVGSMRHHDWEGQLAYSIDSIYTKPGEMSYYASLPTVQNPIVPLIDFIIEEREKAGYFTWFYTRALSPGYTKIHKSGHSFLASSKLGCRYQKFLMEIVPAGTRSAVTSHDALLGKRTFERDTMVVMCCLKNEFRECTEALGEEKEYF
jgi:hypothetical protein